jgi:hypothetical protein
MWTTHSSSLRPQCFFALARICAICAPHACENRLYVMRFPSALSKNERGSGNELSGNNLGWLLLGGLGRFWRRGEGGTWVIEDEWCFGDFLVEAAQQLDAAVAKNLLEICVKHAARCAHQRIVRRC